MKDCPVKYALDVLSGKWTMYIMYILTENESIRFNELQRQVGGISALMLSRTLAELEAHGLVLRREFNVIPPHVEYSLTELGRALTPALDHAGSSGDIRCGLPTVRRRSKNESTSPAERGRHVGCLGGGAV
jgi:DNA-binding HxlR family transcriptional regulator